MKRIPFLVAALVAATFALPVHAQDAMKKDAAVKPADPELKVVLDSWNEIGRKLTAMAEDFPEDKYDYKPTPAQRSFAERPHEWQGREPDQRGDYLRAELQQFFGSGLVRRFVNHPEEDHSHLKEPKHARQIRSEVARNA